MKIRHISGITADVDDELGKRLVSDSHGEWAKPKRAPVAPKHAKKETSPVPAPVEEPAEEE